MNTNYDIGLRIYELRTKYGLSQEELALRAEITTTYLGQLERNGKNPTIHVIEKICNALNLSLAEFFSNQTKRPSDEEDPFDLQLLAQISNRTEEEKQLLLTLVKNTLKLRDLPEHPVKKK